MTSDPAIRCCATCGFLSRQADSPGYEADGDPHLPVSARQRATADFLNLHLPISSMGYRAVPACFVSAVDIDQQFRTLPQVRNQYPDSPAEREAALQIINQPRECPMWTRLRTGLTPREHLAIHILDTTESSRRRFEIATEESRRHFERDLAASIETERREWHQQLADSEARETVRDRRLTIVFAVIAFLLTFAALTRDAWWLVLLLGPAE